MKNFKVLLCSLSLFIYGLGIAQVGINTNSPTAGLDVLTKGNTSATKALKVSNSSNTEMLTLRNDGNLGVSVADPLRKVDIEANNAPLRIRNLDATDRTFNTDGSMRFLAFDTANGDVTQKIAKQRLDILNLGVGASVTVTDPTNSINGTFLIRSSINSTSAGSNFTASFNYARRGIGLLGVAVDSATDAVTSRSGAGVGVTYTIDVGTFSFTITKPANNQITVTNTGTVARDFVIILDPSL